MVAWRKIYSLLRYKRRPYIYPQLCPELQKKQPTAINERLHEKECLLTNLDGLALLCVKGSGEGCL